ncbi:kinase-interacting family protein-like [Tasmannia lanceolata]|uniref:kinase-interacting family protein-like n=1 Tax=Tasmannia lanceolata TaxID=3420 RepID=UPI0040637EEE
MTGNYFPSCRISSRPSWLQATLADIDQKMQNLTVNIPEEDESDSFAERAENYYRKRPQLLTLLQQLYNNYLSLADRYCLSLKTQSQIPSFHSDLDEDSSTDRTVSIPPYPDSDAESSLSYQTLNPILQKPTLTSDESIITELVLKSVDNEILLHELEIQSRYESESTRKIELQKSLLEVMESERLVLLNENARLGFQAAGFAEDNKGLVSEAVFMKRKATELARCVLKMRDDHRICLMSRRIGDLEGQIYGLERINKEYYEEMVRREEEKREVVKKVWLHVEKLKAENAKLKEEAVRGREGWGILKLWDRVKKLDLLCVCGSHSGKCC